MSDNENFGFGKFVPGFDFLQNLAKGASQTLPQMPNLSNWVAPTLNVEELDKRIGELKAVHFWLDQNSKALGATIQALEVQKMTLATLKGMNFSMGEVANALQLKPTDASGGAASARPKPADPAAAGSSKPKSARTSNTGDGSKPVSGVIDPLQWWGALTQQFQEIAAGAMKDATQKTAVDAARNIATGAAKEAMKAASGMAKAATGMAGMKSAPATKTARKAPRKKAAARKTSR